LKDPRCYFFNFREIIFIPGNNYGNKRQQRNDTEGDIVSVIKSLKVRGPSDVIKQGTIVKNTRLTDDPVEIEGRVEKTTIVLKTEFLKKKN
jgi:protein PhnA